MSYWLVRQNAPSVEVGSDFTFLILRWRRRSSVKSGDTIVFLEGRESKIFGHTARVVAVSKVKETGPDQDSVTRYELELLNETPRALDLEVLKFSLTFVRNLQRPSVHFRQGYRRLPEPDFDTIQRGEVFVARTGYLELLAGLPPSLRASFEAEELLMAHSTRFSTFEERLSRLHDFLDARIFSAGRLMHGIHSAARELGLISGDGKPIGHLLSTDVTEATPGARERPDNLETQLQRFRQLDQALARPLNDEAERSATDVIQKVLEELGRPERAAEERRFERIFGAIG